MLKFDDQEFERLIGFRYLGSTLIQGNDITIGIKQRILMAIGASYGSRNN
jgi:hypothetical protein